MIWALLTTILFSLSAITANKTTKIMGGTEANFWRLCWATLCLALYTYTLGTGIHSAAFAMLFISGIVGFGIGDLALFQAYPRLGSRLTVLIVHCLAAPFAALTEYLWIGTQLTWLEGLCAVFILSGVALAIAPDKSLEIAPKERNLGIFFAIVAAIGQGLGAVQSRKAYDIADLAGQPLDGISAAYQRILGGVILSGLTLLFVKRRQVWQAFSPGVTLDEKNQQKSRWGKAWPLVLANGLLGPALGVSCYQLGLRVAPTGIVLPIVAMTPLVVIPFSRWFEGEKPSKRSLIGGALAVLGVVLLAKYR